MTESQVQYRLEESVAVITLNRPRSLNSLNPSVLAELAAAFERCKESSVRAVVLTGMGKGFCVGADVKDLKEVVFAKHAAGAREHVLGLANQLHRTVLLPIRRLEKPVIAAVNGPAVGSGFGLALTCDLRIASTSARFIISFANVGLSADAASTFYFPRLVGPARAMAAFMLDENFDAQKALLVGLVDRVVADNDLMPTTMEIAKRLAHGPTTAYARMKHLLDKSWTNDLEAQLDLEAQGISDCAFTHDFEEGVRAFAEKRPASFTGK